MVKKYFHINQLKINIGKKEKRVLGRMFLEYMMMTANHFYEIFIFKPTENISKLYN